MPWADRLRGIYGVARSLAVYHGRPGQGRIMDAFYRCFLGPGDLAFDLGAHVGNRIRSWRRLGARVVAVEPQPTLMRVLRTLYGRDAGVTLVEAAVAACRGTLTLHLNPANPTIATASAAFLAAAGRAATFRGQRWRGQVTVPAVTLDDLLDRHGEARFVKIDVEGFEAEVLAGLTRAPFAVSFEFVPMTRSVAETCVERLRALSEYRFNASFGDTMALIHPRPLDADGLRRWLVTLGDDGPAGDICACRDPSLLVPAAGAPRP